MLFVFHHSFPEGLRAISYTPFFPNKKAAVSVMTGGLPKRKNKTCLMASGWDKAWLPKLAIRSTVIAGWLLLPHAISTISFTSPGRNIMWE
jgi:hypothetical protein